METLKRVEPFEAQGRGHLRVGTPAAAKSTPLGTSTKCSLHARCWRYRDEQGVAPVLGKPSGQAGKGINDMNLGKAMVIKVGARHLAENEEEAHAS